MSLELGRTLLAPALAMVLLTFFVLVRTGQERFSQIRREKIPWRDIPSGSQMSARFTDTRAADHFRNLFEMPVLFYLALLIAWGIGLGNPLFVFLAWLYVGLRMIHAGIHLGYNRVRHRFAAFLASAAVLLGLWIKLALAFYL